MTKYTTEDVVASLDPTEYDLEEERLLIVDEFCTLVGLGKQPEACFYFFYNGKRAFSVSLTGNPDTYSQELWMIAMLSVSLYHVNIIAIYNSRFAYKHGEENDAIVTIAFDYNHDLVAEQFPYTIDNEKVINLSEKFDLVDDTSIVAPDIITTFKAIKLSHAKEHYLMVPLLLDFMESKGLYVCFYGNFTKETISSDFNKYLLRIGSTS